MAWLRFTTLAAITGLPLRAARPASSSSSSTTRSKPPAKPMASPVRLADAAAPAEQQQDSAESTPLGPGPLQQLLLEQPAVLLVSSSRMREVAAALGGQQDVLSAQQVKALVRQLCAAA